jgi:hypothetical protein
MVDVRTHLTLEIAKALIPYFVEDQESFETAESFRKAVVAASVGMADAIIAELAGTDTEGK